MSRDQDIPIGLCQCGCGQKTKIAPQNHKRDGWVKGQPLRFVRGHDRRKKTPPADFYDPEIPFGYCHCGCGRKTRIVDGANARPSRGMYAGFPLRFIDGHSRRISNPERYEVDPETGCWNWTGALQSNGYGTLTTRDGGSTPIYAHRYMYEKHVGTIPDGLHIDHLCRNRRCCNPAHLEPVTPEENARRGAADRAAGR